MIKKECKKSFRLLGLETIHRRISPSHQRRSMIEENLRREKAGYQGEKSLDYYLSFLSDRKYLIFHGIRLHNTNQYYFQMDILILSQSFFVIIEVKNFGGAITFDEELKQLIQEKDGEIKVYQDPLSQVLLQKRQFAKWLQIHKISSLPIFTFVVISNPYTLIHFKNPSNRLHMVSNSIHLISKIEDIERINYRDVLTKKELQKLTKLLLRENESKKEDLLKQFQIHKDEIIKGVYCPNCFQLPMKRGHGKWYCKQCLQSSKHAHLFSLQDYILLLGTSLTHKQLSDFLQISSRTIATNIIKSLNLPFEGKGKGRVYDLSTLERKMF
ncbi:hypothetical protein BLX88_21920 [Bacillus obstructivus]|nr:hypothetical protein BLX88_21920 [Bacillus obstructivus]